MHDPFLKSVFADRRMIEILIRDHAPEWADEIDFSTLREEPTELVSRKTLERRSLPPGLVERRDGGRRSAGRHDGPGGNHVTIEELPCRTEAGRSEDDDRNGGQVSPKPGRVGSAGRPPRSPAGSAASDRPKVRRGNRGALRQRFWISSADAVSRKSVIASWRFARASATESPWLATSTSGHKATYPLPSRSTIAVKCLLISSRPSSCPGCSGSCNPSKVGGIRRPHPLPAESSTTRHPSTCCRYASG